MHRLPHKTKQFFFVLIKLSIVAGAFYFIYEKLTHNNHLKFSVFTDFVSENGLFELKTIVFLAFLSFLNWFLEILKWKVLINPVNQTNLKEATKQTLGALTASLFTPNRIGEYGAKALYFQSEKRKKVMLTNFVGNLMQMAVTVVFGMVGIYFFIETYQPKFEYANLILILTISLAVAFLIGFAITKSKFSYKGFSFIKIRAFIKNLSTRLISLALILSVLRYAVFSFQFYFLLFLFDVRLTYFEAMTIISAMYFLASVIPSIFIFDVVVKGGVAVYLFTFAQVNSLVVLSVATLMWIFNFVFPSVWGCYYVLTFQLKTKKALS